MPHRPTTKTMPSSPTNKKTYRPVASLLAMTVGYNFAFSRHKTPESLKSFRPPENRGRREDRVRAAPAVSRAIVQNKTAHEHTGSAETLRPSLRNGFTAYTILSPATGLSCHRRRRNCFHRLDHSVGVSGPHDFAVHLHL